MGTPTQPDGERLMAAAVNRQSRIRHMSILPLKFKYEFLGMHLRALTLSDVNTLFAFGNPHMRGGIPDVEHAMQVLWLCSEGYCADPAKASAFAKKLASKYSDAEIIRAAENFIDDMFLDSGAWPDPDGEKRGKRKPPKYAYAALIVAELALRYRWTEGEILAMELPRVFAYLHLGRSDRDPKYAWRQLSEWTGAEILRRKRREKDGIEA